MNSNKIVLVAGGAGYIGSSTCKALRVAGYLPVVFDNLVYGHRDFVQWGDFIQGDLLDISHLETTMKECNPTAVIHFAAFAYVGESVKDPAKYYINNVAGTLNLLSSMIKLNIKKIVFSSSCATYGIPSALPISEGDPQHPVNPYGTSKLMIEKMLHDYDAAYGLRSICLRYFNAAGADPDGDVGEDHTPETHLIPSILDVAADITEKVTVFGEEHCTADGTCIRDYVHVSDLADAHVLALEALEGGISSDQFNLGNGQGYSVKEIIAAVERITGKPIPMEIGPMRLGDPANLVSNPGKAQKVLRWKPKFPTVDTIIEHAWKWYKKRKLDKIN